MRPPEEELKHLLLAPELALLKRIQRRCDALQLRVGDDPALKDSVRGVIVEVLRESGVQEHDRLSGALAPLIVSSMRQEIRNSREMMVDALYPITGQLVKAAVRNAFNELLETINTKLDEGFSVDRWRAKIQSRITGTSEAEILLRRNPELVSGLLTAIMDFTRDAFSDEKGGELRTLTFGESQLFLRTSANTILAAKTTGTPPPRFETALQRVFLSILESWNDFLASFDEEVEDDQKASFIDDLNQRFHDLLRARRKNFRGGALRAYAVIAAVFLLIAIWPAWATYQYYRAQAIEADARNVVESQAALSGYPIDIRYDGDKEALVVTGLLPSTAAKENLVSGLADRLPGVKNDLRLATMNQVRKDEITSSLGAILNTELTKLKASLRQGMVDLETQTQANDAALAEKISKSVAGLDAKFNSFEKTVSQRIENRIATALVPSPTKLLTDWVQTNVLFLRDETQFRNPKLAKALLRELANLVESTPDDLRLRVVGYTDNTGSASLNARLSTERAQTVVKMLMALGVPEDRLITVGRASEKSIGSGENATYNRRVEFEIVFLPE
jgi:outer membrane protein OmpA-like peptidoglycan-associated protein